MSQAVPIFRSGVTFFVADNLSVDVTAAFNKNGASSTWNGQLANMVSQGITKVIVTDNPNDLPMIPTLDTGGRSTNIRNLLNEYTYGSQSEPESGGSAWQDKAYPGYAS
jgi:hypothetical protein